MGIKTLFKAALLQDMQTFYRRTVHQPIPKSERGVRRSLSALLNTSKTGGNKESSSSILLRRLRGIHCQMSILLKTRSVPSEPTAENTHAPGDFWKEVQLERKWERKVIGEKRVPSAQEIVNNEGGLYRESAWQWVTRCESKARHEQRSRDAAEGGGRRRTPDAVKQQNFRNLVPSSSRDSGLSSA